MMTVRLQASMIHKKETTVRIIVMINCYLSWNTKGLLWMDEKKSIGRKFFI